MTTINVPEKIRYAKWKAADIAKAFREGRKPTPGAPGEEAQQAAEEAVPPPTGPPSSAPHSDSALSPVIQRSTPPPGPMADFPPMPPPDAVTPPHSLADPEDGPMSPSAWSAGATLGTSEQFTHPSSIFGPKKSALGKAWVSGELEGRDDKDAGDVEDVLSASSNSKNVHFTPSVTGGLTPSTIQPMDEPFAPSPPPQVPDERYGIPTKVVPSAPVPDPEIPAPSNVPLAPGFVPHPAMPYFSSGLPYLPQPQQFPSYPPPPMHQPTALPPAVEATVTSLPEELTPKTVARIQKHCRFAISALDYEDAETARKELRAALSMLGG